MKSHRISTLQVPLKYPSSAVGHGPLLNGRKDREPCTENLGRVDLCSRFTLSLHCIVINFKKLN